MSGNAFSFPYVVGAVLSLVIGAVLLFAAFTVKSSKNLLALAGSNPECRYWPAAYSSRQLRSSLYTARYWT